MTKLLRNYKKSVSIFKIQFILFIVAIVIGSIFANNLSSNKIDEYKLLSNYFITKFPNSNYLNIDLFKFILWKRVKLILGVWILGFTFFEIMINFLLVIYFGFSIGFLFSVGLITKGFKGYMMYLMLLIPQYLFYIPIIIYLIIKSTKFCTNLYHNNKSKRFNINKQMFVEYFFVLIICIIFTIIGCIMETYINPQLVKWYISVINM
ncbi:MAG: stage II sporulation protein M [Vallitalea sp.]|jgi:stage II sporulation protein M|nr:stage II sporulation protein M [Vallitalea sp.]